MVFRRIEFWIDGDRGSQMRLEKQNWNAEKPHKHHVLNHVFHKSSVGGRVAVLQVFHGNSWLSAQKQVRKQLDQRKTGSVYRAQHQQGLKVFAVLLGECIKQHTWAHPQTFLCHAPGHHDAEPQCW